MDPGYINQRVLSAYMKIMRNVASQRDDPIVCLELMETYQLLNRPVSAYGYLLRAKRLGATVSLEVSSEMQQLLKTGDIYAASKDPEGSYIMGSELARFPDLFEAAVYYLQEAVENGDLHGVAALDLGELLEAHTEHKGYFSTLAKKYFKIAAERGNPQCFPVKSRTDAIK